MKESFRKIISRLQQGKGGPGPPARAIPASTVDASVPPSLPPTTDITGQTVFDDRPLRFRNLTLTEANLPALEDASEVQGAFKIRIAKLSGARRDSGTLVERRYAGRGYQIPGQKQDPHLSTFLAYDEGKIVGTVGVRLDSEEGLSADELYREELDVLRNAGCHLCEFTRLAVDSSAASKSVLAGLFHTAYLYAARIRGITHAVIEVNPRHVVFYGKALKFEPIGPERLNTRVNAPAVLLCVAFETITEGLATHAGKVDASGAGRSLFAFGFPPDEEVGVLERLRELVAAG